MTERPSITRKDREVQTVSPQSITSECRYENKDYTVPQRPFIIRKTQAERRDSMHKSKRRKEGTVVTKKGIGLDLDAA